MLKGKIETAVLRSLEFSSSPIEALKFWAKNAHTVIVIVDDIEDIIMDRLYKRFPLELFLQVLYDSRKQSFSRLGLVRLLYQSGFKDVEIVNDAVQLGLSNHRTIVYREKTYQIPLFVVRAVSK